MRIRIKHRIEHEYEAAPRSVMQVLRMSPSDHDGQHVASWRIDIDVDGRLRAGEDAYRNHVHSLAVDGPVGNFVIEIEGEVETTDLNGMVRGTLERFPLTVWLRESRLANASEAIVALSAEALAGADDPLERAHRLAEAVGDAVAYDPQTGHETTPAADALEAKKGCARDMAHLLIATARCAGIPARYVSGYRIPEEPETPVAGMHAWAELAVEGFGWVAFDPSHRICPTEVYVRAAIGLDAESGGPLRTSRIGGAGETRREIITVTQAGRRTRN